MKKLNTTYKGWAICPMVSDRAKFRNQWPVFVQNILYYDMLPPKDEDGLLKPSYYLLFSAIKAGYVHCSKL